MEDELPLKLTQNHAINKKDFQTYHKNTIIDTNNTHNQNINFSWNQQHYTEFNQIILSDLQHKIEDSKKIQKKISVLQDSLEIYIQQNKLKDQEIMNIEIEFTNKKEKLQEFNKQYKQQYKKIQKISRICLNMDSKILEQQQRNKKQNIFMSEQNYSIQSFHDKISKMQNKLSILYNNLEQKQQLASKYEQICNRNQYLKQQFKTKEMINNKNQFNHHRNKQQTMKMENKCYEKDIVIHNKMINIQKLRQKIKQSSSMQNIESYQDQIQWQHKQIRQLQLQVGDLSQNMIVMNEQIKKIQKLITTKQHIIQQMRQSIVEKQIQTKKGTQKQQNHTENQKQFTKVHKKIQNTKLLQKNKTPKIYQIIQSEQDQTKMLDPSIMNTNGKKLINPKIQTLIARYEKIKSMSTINAVYQY